MSRRINRLCLTIKVLAAQTKNKKALISTEAPDSQIPESQK